MKQTFFILKNNTGSVGQYLLNDEYIYLNPGETITLNSKPTNHTANITVSLYRKEVPVTKISTKKSVFIENKTEGEE